MKKTFNIILIVLCVISVACYFFADWIKNNYQDHFTYQTNFFGQNTKAPDSSIEADADTAFTFVVNYYANEDGSGIEMYELRLNYYTDYKFQDVYSLGVQILNPNNMKFNANLDKIDNPLIGDSNLYFSYTVDFKETEVSYYNTDDGVSFDATETFNSRNVPYIINIEDKPYAFNFNKENTELKSTNWYGKKTYENFTSNFDYFLYKIYDSTTHITDGDGIYKNLKLELNDVFNLYEYNSTTGKFDILNTMFGYDVDYVSFKVNYHKRGAMTHSDSMFKQIGDYANGGVIWKNS